MKPNVGVQVLVQPVLADYLVDCGNTRYKVTPNSDALQVHSFDDDALLTWFQSQRLEGKHLVALAGNEARTQQVQTLCFNEGARCHLFHAGDWSIAGTYPSMGLDRIAAGIAAMDQVGQNLIVIDAGTMLTITAWIYDSSAAFKLRLDGGFIAPGPEATLHAMHHAAPALPRLASDPAQQDLGTDTQSHMQAAVNIGWPAMAHALIKKAQSSFADAQLVCTGGNAELLRLDAVEPRQDLVLRGLQLYINASS